MGAPSPVDVPGIALSGSQLRAIVSISSLYAFRSFRFLGWMSVPSMSLASVASMIFGVPIIVDPVKPCVNALIVFFLGVCDGLFSPIIFLATSDGSMITAPFSSKKESLSGFINTSETLTLITSRNFFPASLASASFMPVASITNFK